MKQHFLSVNKGRYKVIYGKSPRKHYQSNLQCDLASLFRKTLTEIHKTAISWETEI